MIKSVKYTFLFLLTHSILSAQTTPVTSTDSVSNPIQLQPQEQVSVQAQEQPQPIAISAEQPQQEFIFKPTIGLGVGVFNFFGDVYEKHFQSPTIGRMAYDLSLSQKLNDYLQLNFYTLFGRLGANETIARRLNFESQIRLGGVSVSYNFNHFLPADRIATPYISLGFESFEFLTKTDLYDANGNRYNYWSDGTIRSAPQNSSSDASVIKLDRDYVYETDMRERNLDGFGKYREQSFAIPLGIGASFKLTDQWNFRLGTTMHFTFTDYIDGITEKSIGDRAGNKKSDHFMMTSFSLHYTFDKKEKEQKYPDGMSPNDVDFLALDAMDSDGDGVTDDKDSCQGTPAQVVVDAKGCPGDDDNDGVPNFKDDELTTPANAIVNERGVQLTDSLIAHQYAMYMDSTGAFATVESYFHNGRDGSSRTNQKEYTIQIATFDKGLPPEMMTKFLSIGDISSTTLNDSTTVYTAGKYNSLTEAESRKNMLMRQGYPTAKVVYNKGGKFIDAPSSASLANATDLIEGDINEKGLVLRVQLGAYRNRISKSVFRDISDLMEVKTEDGLHKYMTGSFTSFEAAAKRKVDLILSGYEGAFITAYKDGKRVSLQESGATLINEGDVLETTPDDVAISGVSKRLVSFKVQVGIFKNEPPADKLEKITKLKNATGELTRTGLNRYTIGPFEDYKTAMQYKDEAVEKYGIEDAFIIALFNGEYITVQEALELLK